MALHTLRTTDQAAGMDAESLAPGHLLQNADAALYASKSSGRNRFSFFSPVAGAQLENSDDLAPSLQPAQQENPSAAGVA